MSFIPFPIPKRNLSSGSKSLPRPPQPLRNMGRCATPYANFSNPHPRTTRAPQTPHPLPQPPGKQNNSQTEVDKRRREPRELFHWIWGTWNPRLMDWQKLRTSIRRKTQKRPAPGDEGGRGVHLINFGGIQSLVQTRFWGSMVFGFTSDWQITYCVCRLTCGLWPLVACGPCGLANVVSHRMVQFRRLAAHAFSLAEENRLHRPLPGYPCPLPSQILRCPAGMPCKLLDLPGIEAKPRGGQYEHHRVGCHGCPWAADICNGAKEGRADKEP